MSIFEVRATASHRYYMNKSKRDIVQRIHMMGEQLDRLGPEVHRPIWSNMSERQLMDNYTKDRLASLAMQMHDYFPETGQ